MGYTHYWKINKPLTINAEQKKLIKQVLKEHKAILFGGMGNGKPTFNDTILELNGDVRMGEDYENFMVEFGKTSSSFTFCKTARRPYDLAVCKILLILSLSDGFSFSSDGNIDGQDWHDALDWAVNVVKIKPNLNSGD